MHKALPESKQSQQLDSLDASSTDKITNIEIKKDRVTSIIQEYPIEYDQQEIFDVEFDYIRKDPLSDSTREIPFSFVYRAGSELLIIDFDSHDNISNEVEEDIKLLLSDILNIYAGTGVSREGLWEFIMSASEKVELELMHEGEIITFDKLSDKIGEENIIRKKMVSSAELRFRSDGEDVRINYTNGSISIDYDSEEGKEYVIQNFEAKALSD
ncbi:MAG: hypothetical protein U5J64_10380 [Halobacteriales archaeon]|nr:hypothetical protein [Halobacteriales archaeon]